MSLAALTPEEDARRRALHDAGLTNGEMAAELGITRQAVHVWLQSRGLRANMPRRGQPRAEIRVTVPADQWARVEEAAARDGKPPVIWAAERIAALAGRRDGVA